jgi:hypothetical protein
MKPDEAAVLEAALAELGIEARRVLSTYRKSTNRTIWEIEDVRGCILIVKRSKPELVRSGFSALQLLAGSGFRPPNRYLVPEPVAISADGTVSAQSRAHGSELLHALKDSPEAAEELGRSAAGWLAALHTAEIEGVGMRRSAAAARFDDRRLTELFGEARSAVAAYPVDEGPCHGDYHAKHVFVDGSGRVTSIDLEKFGIADRTAEVGYFLAQTASIGWTRFGSFEATRELRQAFLSAYLGGRRMSRLPGLHAHVALTLLRVLAFHQKVRTESPDLRRIWIDAVERVLRSNGDLPELCRRMR